jgi:hypothetical protein
MPWALASRDRTAWLRGHHDGHPTITGDPDEAQRFATDDEARTVGRVVNRRLAYLLLPVEVDSGRVDNGPSGLAGRSGGNDA